MYNIIPPRSILKLLFRRIWLISSVARSLSKTFWGLFCFIIELLLDCPPFCICSPDRSVLFGVSDCGGDGSAIYAGWDANSGNNSQNLEFFSRFQDLDSRARNFLSESDVSILPVVGVDSSIKDNKPVKIEATLHEGFHNSAIYRKFKALLRENWRDNLTMKIRHC